MQYSTMAKANDSSATALDRTIRYRAGVEESASRDMVETHHMVRLADGYMVRVRLDSPRGSLATHPIRAMLATVAASGMGGVVVESENVSDALERVRIGRIERRRSRADSRAAELADRHGKNVSDVLHTLAKVESRIRRHNAARAAARAAARDAALAAARDAARDVRAGADSDAAADAAELFAVVDRVGKLSRSAARKVLGWCKDRVNAAATALESEGRITTTVGGPGGMLHAV